MAGRGGAYARSSVQHYWSAVAAAILGAWCVVASPLPAQSPPASGAPAVEFWYGLKKIQAPIPVTGSTAAPAAPGFTPLRSPNWIDPPLARSDVSVAPALLPQPAAANPTTEDSHGQQTGVVGTVTSAPILHTAHHVADGEREMVTADGRHRLLVSSSATPPAGVGAPNAEPTRSTNGSNNVAGSPFAAILAQTTALLGALVLCVLVLEFVTARLLRRYGASLKNLFRIEVVVPPGWGNQPAALPVAIASPVVVPPVERVEVKEEEPRAPNFELGPTFEEEKQKRKVEVAQKEAAMLQFICDQNLRLRTEIASRQSEGELPAEPEHEPAALVAGQKEEGVSHAE